MYTIRLWETMQRVCCLSVLDAEVMPSPRRQHVSIGLSALAWSLHLRSAGRRTGGCMRVLLWQSSYNVSFMNVSRAASH